MTKRNPNKHIIKLLTIELKSKSPSNKNSRQESAIRHSLALRDRLFPFEIALVLVYGSNKNAIACFCSRSQIPEKQIVSTLIENLLSTTSNKFINLLRDEVLLWPID